MNNLKEGAILPDNPTIGTVGVIIYDGEKWFNSRDRKDTFNILRMHQEIDSDIENAKSSIVVS